VAQPVHSEGSWEGGHKGVWAQQPPRNAVGRFVILSFKSFCNELDSEHLFNFYTALFPTQNIIKVTRLPLTWS